MEGAGRQVRIKSLSPSNLAALAQIYLQLDHKSYTSFEIPSHENGTDTSQSRKAVRNP